jgi:cytochrome c-type protein NapB
MKKKVTIILILCTLYAGAALFFFVQKMTAENQEKRFAVIIEKEEIVELDRRATLRAFYTAPPVIPHEVESRDSKDCLRCHLNVTKLEDGRVAMQTPHPQFSNCLQCHAPSLPGGPQEVASTWEGLEEPKRGDRWFWTSPPTIPHRLYLRENCLSCHGPQNPDMRLRTTHPERTQCLQCHVPNYANEF